MTPLDIVTLALKDAGVVGVGQTPLAEDTNDAFTKLNMMLGQWNRRRWLVYHLVDLPLVATGAASYTIGAGGLFNVARPDRLEHAYGRFLGGSPFDFPLSILAAREDYDLIPLKGLVGPPRYVFLDSDYPLGKLYAWPIPPVGLYEIHIVLKAELAQFATLTQDIALPDEYREALHYNLTARLRPQYGKPPDPTVTALARSSLNTIRNANAQVPELQMPDALVGPGTFNIYSGDYR